MGDRFTLPSSRAVDTAREHRRHLDTRGTVRIHGRPNDPVFTGPVFTGPVLTARC